MTRLEKYWLNNGPYPRDAMANAMHHLKRFNYSLYKGKITPLPGFVPSKEERMAIDYLVEECEFTYAPPAK